MITEGVVPSLHVDYKSSRIKPYHKEGRALRTETTINNTRDFRNPYAYSAARILADFDTLVRAVLTTRHIGLMDRREAERCMALGARALRRAMGTALGHKYEGREARGMSARAMPRRRGRGSGWGDVPRDPRRPAAGPASPERRPIIKPPAGMAGSSSSIPPTFRAAGRQWPGGQTVRR
ncbi:MAG: AcaB family transcriptional regulator [Gammaproteobacteria bacterium]